MRRALWTLTLTACTSAGPTTDLASESGMQEVRITMGSQDQASMFAESRQFADLFTGDCLAAPQESPFQWYAGQVTIDGQELTDVGVRKKGFLGSLSTTRPSLKLKFNKFDDTQLYNDRERMTLNNNRQDPSRLRTCLTYLIFETAGYPAPACEFAHVVVNEVDHGVYSSVEAIKKDFLRRTFGSADGDLYEGTLSDFRDGWTQTYEPKTDATDGTRAPILALTDALESPDEALESALAEVLDLPEFYRFWALETITGHWDGYAGNTNNHFIYRDPADGLLHFIPWGADAVFYDGESEFTPLLFQGELTRRLYATSWGRAAYIAALDELFDSVWDEDQLVETLESWRGLIHPTLLHPEETDSAIDDLIRTIQGRRDLFAEGIALGGYDVDIPPKDDPCLELEGDLSVTFDTTFGTLDLNPFETGTATWSAEHLGEAVPPIEAGGASAGFDEYGQAVVAVFGLHTQFSVMEQLFVVLPTDELTTGPVMLDVLIRPAYYLRSSPPEAEGEFVAMATGTMQLSEASTTSGARITGEIEAKLLLSE